MKKLLVALLLFSSFSPTAKAKNLDADHASLTRHVVLAGIDVQVNPKQCWMRSGIHGWYKGGPRELVICQVNKTQAGVEVNWTKEDLDTLRHEAHHLVQDCMDEKIDGQLSHVYDTPSEFAMGILGPDEFSSVLTLYRDTTPKTRILELEAFAVAQMADPQEQVQDVKTYCL